MKTCTKCKEEKELTEFCKLTRSKDGLYPSCKVCEKKHFQEWYDKNKETYIIKVKEYVKVNREKVLINKRNYYLKNKEKRFDIKKIADKKYREKNMPYLLAKNRAYRKIRRANDIQYKLRCNVSGRIKVALNGSTKPCALIKYLGCTPEYLKKYLESKFKEGMSWSNYGYHGWHIDHIKPLSRFDLLDENQFLEACHYTNLQPLWKIDNMRKSNKMIV